LLVALAATLMLLLGVPAGSAPVGRASTGGALTFVLVGGGPGTVLLDPALAVAGYEPFRYATCSTLMAFRDAPGQEGYSVRPEAATGLPQVSADGLSYVFTVRKGLRFSDGSPLTAANFVRALVRVLSPTMASPGADLYSDIRRVSAKGDRLRIVLRQPTGDLEARLALMYACPVPLGFPIDPAGVPLMVGSGPYYVTQPSPTQVVLVRNRYYHGDLPHRLSRFEFAFADNLDDAIHEVETGDADVLLTEIPGDVRKVLEQQYGIDRQQLFRESGLYTEALVLNTSSPLFHDNLPLRKAVNLAIDRPAVIAQTLGGPLSDTPTDQILPSRTPGWVNYHLYPLTGPDLAAAQPLAAGHLRGGIAVLYTTPDTFHPAMAAVIADDLAKIGLTVEVKQFAAPVMMSKVETRGEPFDMVLGDWGSQLYGPRGLPELEAPIVYPDPAQMLVRYLDGENARKPTGNTNVSYLDLPAYNQRLAAASSLSGPARFQTFSRIEADIMREQAPWAPLWQGSSWTLVSKRVGCFHRRPVVGIVWGDLCLR
jgi:peptide/nickel transport system substrate-binding protein